MLKNIKDLNTRDKVGLVLWSVSVGLYMTYVIKETKKNMNEIDALGKAFCDDTQRVKDSLY